MDSFEQGMGKVRSLEDRLGAGWDLGYRSPRPGLPWMQCEGWEGGVSLGGLGSWGRQCPWRLAGGVG